MQTPAPTTPPTIWCDVEDLLHYVRANSRPSGIQRVCLEIHAALIRAYGTEGRIRFVRHADQGTRLTVLGWGELSGHIAALVPQLAASPPSGSGRLGRLTTLLPAPLRPPATRLAIALADSLSAARRRLRRLLPGQGAPPPASLATLARPGDVLLVLGSPWFQPRYGALADWARGELGLRLAVLMHDIIPLRRPEWCDRGVIETFRAWHEAVLPRCDLVLANSRATAADVEDWAAASGLRLPGPVQPVPMGTDFATAEAASAPTPREAAALPEPGSYVLIVSTIEVRKNHLLAFRVWRRLLETMPPSRVPVLVFAGRVGWLVDDLMRQLANCDWLDGKIRLIEAPSDAQLRALYRGCRFTLFPSMYEGWGLPVTESLGLGKPCLAADIPALREAGGVLVRLFDPDDLKDATEAVRRLLDDPADLAAWEEQVRARFRPASWDRTAATVVRAVDALSAPAPAKLQPAAPGA